jgi:hypothetical protein
VGKLKKKELRNMETRRPDDKKTRINHPGPVFKMSVEVT